MKIDVCQIQHIENEMLKEVFAVLQENNIRAYLAFGSVLGSVRHQGPIPWDYDTDIFIWLDDVERAVKALRDRLSHRFRVDCGEGNGTRLTLFPRVGLMHTSSATVHVDVFLLYGVSDDQSIRSRQYKRLTMLDRIYTHYKVRSRFARKQLLFQVAAKAEELLFLPLTNRRIRNKYYQTVRKYHSEDSEYVGFVGMAKGEHFFRRALLDPAVEHTYAGFTARIPNKYNEYLTELYGDYMQYPPEAERNVRMKFTTVIDDRDAAEFFQASDLPEQARD